MDSSSVEYGHEVFGHAYCEGHPVGLVGPFGLSPQGNTGGTIWDILKRELNIHDILGLAGIIPFVGIVADLADAVIYAYEGEPLKAALSVVCAIPEIGDVIGIVRKGTKIAKVAKVISTSIRTAQKIYVTAASASAALDLAGDAKIEYAVNGGNMTSSVKAKIGAAALMAGVAALSGKSAMKDVRRMARMADIRFKTTRLEMSDAASGKKIQYGGVGGCFTAGTKVKTEDGEKNIEEVEEGDYVLAENPETGEQEYKRVVRTFIREKYTIIHVFIGSEEIETTEEHPFYVESVGFVPAGELRAGDIIRTADGRNLPITKVEREELEEPVLVYNFEVEDFHTYYVSGLGVLVHNTCPVTGNVKSSSNPRKILNVGAGDNPIPCATNIDINPGGSGVLFGDANDLSQFASGQFDHVIALNPYKYNLLDSDVPRVLKDGGIMSVTGNYSNKYFKKIYNASPEVLRQSGFEIISKGDAGSAFVKYGRKVTGGARQIQGTPLQIILRKVGGQ